jgi:hypothetical protein
MSFGFGFALPAYPLRGGGGNNPFNQDGATLDLSFIGTAGDLSGADTYTLNTNFITPQYQIAAQYAVWESGVGLAQKTFAQIVTFTRASTATYFNSAGTLTSAAVDEARFDYNPSTLAAQGLLIEESRTNLLLQSADFTTTWTQTNVTITANSTASPDGGTNGDTLLINVAGATTSQTSQSFTAGSTITVSVFGKKNASNFLRFEVGGLVNCWFDLNTGVTGTNSAGSGNVLFSAKSIQAISNGWYRCILTVTTTTITTLGVNIFATNTDNSSSSINSSIFLWGAQVEAGAFPTSYIPTTTTALTRSADVASVNTLSPWYNASAGTLYAEFTARLNVTQTPVTFSGAAGVGYRIRKSGTNQYVAVLRDGATKDIAITPSPALTEGQIIKVALGVKVNDCALSGGGQAVATQTSFSPMPTITDVNLGFTGTDGFALNGWFRRFTYYPRRLSNADLQAITT